MTPDAAATPDIHAIVHAAAIAPALAALHALAFPPSQTWGPDAIGLMFRMPGAFGFWRPAGGFVLARVAADESEILTLAVVPAARRHGVGAGLMTAAMVQAGARGAAAMVLEVAESNAPALALYHRLGFAVAGRRRRYYETGEDALVLRRGLG